MLDCDAERVAWGGRGIVAIVGQYIKGWHIKGLSVRQLRAILHQLVSEVRMFSARIGRLLKNARRQLDLSREELARRGGVSTRLVAELERGQRPNVSLESALKLLQAVGVSVVATAPNGAIAEIRSRSAADLARAARAARRRQTWTGRQIFLHDDDEDPRPKRSTAKRLTSVGQVSKQAFLVASAAAYPSARQTKRHSSR
jgi:transcriptional regulator with XRE-family HTH domain